MRLADLKLNPDNPRNIKPDKLEKLAQSIKDFPKMMLKRPIVYDENKIIIGGNMRYKAIEKLGMTEIPDEWTSDASDFTPDERRRFIMQDNAEMGEHDWDMVANQYELEDLDAWGIDVPYADTADEVEEDEAPEVSSEPPLSELGKIYQLGRHRVMCGDSTDKASVELLMNGEKADMVFTDPPYALFGNSTGVANVVDDKMTRPFFLAIFKNFKYITKQFGHIYTCCDWHSAFSLQAMAAESGLKPKNLCIWDKGDGGVGAMYQQCYEMVWFHANSPISNKTMGKTKAGERTIQGKPNIWRFPRVTGERVHNAEKPVGMISFPITNSSEKGEIVGDLFLGSGSTLIACEQTDRTCYGMELDPKYVDVIRKRYAKFVSPDNTLPENWEELTPPVVNNAGNMQGTDE